MVLIAIWLCMIAIGLLIRNSKKIAFVQICFIVFMMTFNDGNPDQINFIKLIDRLTNNPIEIFSGNVGTNLVFYVFSIFGSYHIVAFLIALCSMIFIYMGTVFYTSKVSLVLSLYMIAPFTIDATQLKNFMAMAVWFFFSKYLFMAYKKENVERNVVMYIVGVILATSLHFSFIFTMLFLVSLVVKAGSRKLFIGYSITIVVLFFIMSNAGMIISRLASSVGTYGTYFSFKVGFYQTVSREYKIQAKREEVIAFFAVLAFILVFMRLMGKKKESNDYGKLLLEFSTSLSIISVIILPFLDYSMEIYRVQRNLLLIYYVLMAEWIPDKLISKIPQIKVRLSFPFLFAMILSAFYLYIDTLQGNFGAVFRVLFKYYKY